MQEVGGGGKKSNEKTVLSEFSGKVPGWGKVQAASGRRQGGDRQGLHTEGEMEKLKKKKKITSEGGKNLEWELVNIQYLVL